MLTYALLACVFNPAQAAPPTAAALISQMFARYSSAKTLSGTIKTSQVAGAATVLTDTNLAYERPSKIRLDQRQRGREINRKTVLISDGTKFAYTPPNRVLNSAPFLMELVQPEGRPAQTLNELYAVVAADLPDRSPVLDALIARPDDLRYFANQLSQFKLSGKATIGNREANVIEGDWRESADNFKGGEFRIFVTDEGELLRYVLIQNFAAPGAGTRQGRPVIGNEQITVTTTWDLAITVNAPVEAGTFALKTN